jgi:hypothetical protein
LDRITLRAGARERVVVAAALAFLPAGAVATAGLWWTLATFWGGGLWPAQPVTLAEAAATRDEAEVERLIGYGDNPNAPADVRPGLLAVAAVRVTPLEAAVWSRDAEMLALLLRNGAIATSSQLRTLRCLNDRWHDADVRATLERLGADPWPACDTAAPPK